MTALSKIQSTTTLLKEQIAETHDLFQKKHISLKEYQIFIERVADEVKKLNIREGEDPQLFSTNQLLIYDLKQHIYHHLDNEVKNANAMKVVFLKTLGLEQFPAHPSFLLLPPENVELISTFLSLEDRYSLKYSHTSAQLTIPLDPAFWAMHLYTKPRPIYLGNELLTANFREFSTCIIQDQKLEKSILLLPIFTLEKGFNYWGSLPKVVRMCHCILILDSPFNKSPLLFQEVSKELRIKNPSAALFYTKMTSSRERKHICNQMHQNFENHKRMSLENSSSKSQAFSALKKFSLIPSKHHSIINEETPIIQNLATILGKPPEILLREIRAFTGKFYPIQRTRVCLHGDPHFLDNISEESQGHITLNSDINMNRVVWMIQCYLNQAS